MESLDPRTAGHWSLHVRCGRLRRQAPHELGFRVIADACPGVSRRRKIFHGPSDLFGGVRRGWS